RPVPGAREVALAPGRRGDEPDRLVAQVEARRTSEAEALRPVLLARPAAVRAALVEAVADRVEVRVARLRERLGEHHRAVDVRVPVAEAEVVLAVGGDG